MLQRLPGDALPWNVVQTMHYSSLAFMLVYIQIQEFVPFEFLSIRN
jgi:hypothetical protein